MYEVDQIQWIKNEFQPVSLATPDTTIIQAIQNAKRYWNTHSAYPLVRMYPATPGTISVQLSPDFSSVVKVYPATDPDWILQNYPLWSLLGITIIDNLTSDLIELAEGFRNYRYYIGTDFHFHFEKSDDSNVGGTLYLNGLPYNTNKVAVVGTYRIADLADVKSDTILDWILYYAKAQVKMMEGNTLRKTSAIDVKNDGQELVNEGKEEVENLQKKLAEQSRWICFGKRF